MKTSFLIFVLVAACAAQTQTLKLVAVYFAANGSTPNAIQFLCSQKYDRAACVKDATALRQAIAPYPVQLLEAWSFVLVPADDWKALVRGQGGDPVSPAFSMLDQRVTLLDGSLFVASARRNKELIQRFDTIGPALVDLAVTHEMGHGICLEKDERRADDYGRQLRSSQTPDCRRGASRTKLGSGNAIELPIQLYWDYLVVVEGSIGNLEKLAFIIDTGTYPSVIDQKIAMALGLKERDGEVALVNRSVPTKLVTLPLVAVGPVRVEDVPVRVQDLSSIEKRLARRIDAVVGLDVLGNNSFSIDYRTKRLRFGSVKRTPSAVSFETGTSFVIVEARLHDHPVRLMVDTGTSALVLFQSHLKSPLSQFSGGRAATATDGGGGDFRLQPVLIPDARLGKQELGPLTGFVVADQGHDGRDFDGLLSVRGLHLEEIGFDFENHEISWRK